MSSWLLLYKRYRNLSNSIQFCGFCLLLYGQENHLQSRLVYCSLQQCMGCTLHRVGVLYLWGTGCLFYTVGHRVGVSHPKRSRAALAVTPALLPGQCLHVSLWWDRLQSWCHSSPAALGFSLCCARRWKQGSRMSWALHFHTPNKQQGE